MLSRFPNADSAVGLADALGFYMDAGGFVMPPLILATVVLWFALGARWALLRRGSKKNVRVLLKKYADGKWLKVSPLLEQLVAEGKGFASVGQ